MDVCTLQKVHIIFDQKSSKMYTRSIRFGISAFLKGLGVLLKQSSGGRHVCVSAAWEACHGVSGGDLQKCCSTLRRNFEHHNNGEGLKSPHV